MAVKPHPNKGQSKASGGVQSLATRPLLIWPSPSQSWRGKNIVKTNESIAVDKVAQEMFFFAALSIVNSANSGHSTPGFFYRKWQMEITVYKFDSFDMTFPIDLINTTSRFTCKWCYDRRNCNTMCHHVWPVKKSLNKRAAVSSANCLKLLLRHHAHICSLCTGAVPSSRSILKTYPLSSSIDRIDSSKSHSKQENIRKHAAWRGFPSPLACIKLSMEASQCITLRYADTKLSLPPRLNVCKICKECLNPVETEIMREPSMTFFMTMTMTMTRPKIANNYPHKFITSSWPWVLWTCLHLSSFINHSL